MTNSRIVCYNFTVNMTSTEGVHSNTCLQPKDVDAPGWAALYHLNDVIKQWTYELRS